jgi:hypothetical protein
LNQLGRTSSEKEQTSLDTLEWSELDKCEGVGLVHQRANSLTLASTMALESANRWTCLANQTCHNSRFIGEVCLVGLVRKPADMPWLAKGRTSPKIIILLHLRKIWNCGHFAIFTKVFGVSFLIVRYTYDLNKIKNFHIMGTPFHFEVYTTSFSTKPRLQTHSKY